MKDVDKHFVSTIDQKFGEFDATHPKSPSQLAEINKYKRLNELRDYATSSPSRQDDKMWQDF